MSLPSNTSSTVTLHDPQLISLPAKDVEKVGSEQSSQTVTISFFKNHWQEAGFLVAIMLGQMFSWTPFGATLAVQKQIAADLGVPNQPGQIDWIVASYSLTTGSFVLVGGRLGDVYGHRIVWLLSLVWQLIWNFVSGFAKSPAFYGTARGLAGVGTGIMAPSSIALLASSYPPGLKRNVIFGLFGALAPFAAAGAAIFDVLLAYFVNTHWMWWFHAIKNALTLLIGITCIPKSVGTAFGGAVDFIGAIIGVSGLILFNFAFNQAPTSGWGSAIVLAPFFVGLALFVAFSFWELKFAKEPILPFDIWTVCRHLCDVLKPQLLWCLALLTDWEKFMFDFRGANPIQMVAYVSPITVNGVLAACLAGFLISRVTAQAMFITGQICICLSMILLATAPVKQSYWLSTFFSGIFAPFSSDFIFTAAQIISSNTVKPSQQGVAGSLVATVFNYGLALGIGLAGTVEAHTNNNGTNELKGVRSALYFGIGLSVLSFLLVVVFVRVPKDTREGYDEELREEAAVVKTVETPIAV